jgi:hypothetical protein
MKRKTKIKLEQKDAKTGQWLVIFAISIGLLFRTPQIIRAIALSQNTADSDSETEEASDASELEETEATTIDNIKKVIQEKKDELGDLNRNIRSKQAYLAKVNRVTEETLTVETTQGNKIIPIEEGIELEKELDEIEINDWIGVYGELEDDNFVSKKIAVYSKDFSPKNKKIMLASITEIHGNNLTVTERNSDQKTTFVINSSTDYQDYQGEEASVDDLYNDLQCLIIAFENSSGDYVVSTLKALTVFDE